MIAAFKAFGMLLLHPIWGTVITAAAALTFVWFVTKKGRRLERERREELKEEVIEY